MGQRREGKDREAAVGRKVRRNIIRGHRNPRRSIIIFGREDMC